MHDKNSGDGVATGHPILDAAVVVILAVHTHRATFFVQCRYWNSAVFSSTHASSRTSPALPSPSVCGWRRSFVPCRSGNARGSSDRVHRPGFWTGPRHVASRFRRAWPDMAGVEQVQPLRRAGGVVPLGFQARIARRAAEQFEKRAGDAAVGQRDGALFLGDERPRLRESGSSRSPSFR